MKFNVFKRMVGSSRERDGERQLNTVTYFSPIDIN
jgi:hypothetical protein